VEVDVSSGDAGEAADRVAEWLGTIGGLSFPAG
jgi:hypothetical protein